MAFTKREYEKNKTIITSQNLNDIQDELIRVGAEAAEIENAVSGLDDRLTEANGKIDQANDLSAEIGSKTIPLTQGGTGATSAAEAITNLNVYPVGSVYITSTNASPASYLGGTWELIDKEFKIAVLKKLNELPKEKYNPTQTIQ